MRSMWMWFLIMLPLQVADSAWEKNEYYMNLVIGIRHAVPTTPRTQPPEKVKEIIKTLADKLTLGQYYTGVAIVEMRGDDAELLLDVSNGEDQQTIKTACNDIGTRQYGGLIRLSMVNVVRKIRKKTDWTAHHLFRDYMPNVVLVFWEVGDDFLGVDDTIKKIILNEAYNTVQDGGGFVFLNHFRGQSSVEAMVVFPIFGSNKVQYQNPGASYDEVATAAKKTVSDSVGLCWYDWARRPPCYWHPVLGCVENATNDIKYNDGSHDGQLWEYLEKWYCCKRATITNCPSSRPCPTTTTSTTTSTSTSTTTTTTTTTTTPTTTTTTTTLTTSLATSTPKRSTTTKAILTTTTFPTEDTSTTATTVSPTTTSSTYIGASETTTNDQPATKDSGVDVEDEESKVALGVGVACALVIPTVIVVCVFLLIKKFKKGKDQKSRRARRRRPTASPRRQTGKK